MTTWSARYRNARHGGEGGPDDGLVALIVAATVTAMLALLVTITVQTGSSDVSATVTTRESSQARNAAQAGLDATFAAIQSATSQSTLPCGTGAKTGTLPTVPTTSSFTVSVTYFSATTPSSGTTISCANLSSTVPASAELVSTGTDGTQTQYQESLLTLTATSTSPVFADTLFSDSSLTISQDSVGTSAAPATIYSPQNIYCENNSTVYATVISTGNGGNTGAGAGVNLAGCTVNGSITSTYNVDLQNQSTVSGSVSSTGPGSPNTACASNEGGVTWGSGNGTTAIGGAVTAFCTTTGTASYVKGGITQNDHALSNPSAQTMPTVSYASPAWTSANWSSTPWGQAGWSLVIPTDCGTGGSVSFQQAVTNMSLSNAPPTVILATCALTLNPPNSGTYELNNNLAIIDAQTSSPSLTINGPLTSASSATHDVYMIQPTSYAGTTSSCVSSPSSGGITINAQAEFGTTTAPLDTMTYTPCDLAFQQNSGNYDGQIYSGAFTGENGASVVVPTSVPTLPGATSGGGGGSGSSTFTVTVAQERRTSSATFN